MQCPRCKTQIIGRREVCQVCGANLTLAFRVNLAAGAVILVAGGFFLALSAAEMTLSFLPLGLAELAVGLFIDVKAASGLKALGAVGAARKAESTRNAA